MGSCRGGHPRLYSQQFDVESESVFVSRSNSYGIFYFSYLGVRFVAYGR